jgi:hypothetical protein
LLAGFGFSLLGALESVQGLFAVGTKKWGEFELRFLFLEKVLNLLLGHAQRYTVYINYTYYI